jgi:hypothetical protein
MEKKLTLNLLKGKICNNCDHLQKWSYGDTCPFSHSVMQEYARLVNNTCKHWTGKYVQ